MNTFNIGKLIKEFRIQMGISQEEFSNGVCDISTLSKIERGKRHPSRACAEALMQRLGSYNSSYRLLVDAREFKVQNLQLEITACIVNYEWEDANKKIIELESMIKERDNILQQFVEHSRLLLRISQNDNSEEMNKQILELLFETIRRTVPGFDIDEIEKHLFTFEEVEIINNIAIMYAKMGDRRKAIDIYRQLFKYTEKHYINMQETASVIALVAYNFSKQLGLDRNYNEAIEVAEKGYEFCVKYGKTRLMGGLIFNMAYCYYEIGEIEECKIRLYEAYYISHAMRKYNDCDTISKYAKEKFDIVFP